MLSRLLGALGLSASLAAAHAAPPAADPLGALRPLYERLYLLPADAPVAAGGLRGLVVEVDIDGGIDVLAVYPDGRLRYLNHSGRPVVVDAPIPALAEPMRLLWRSAGTAAGRAQRWARDGSLPARDGVRIAFIGSDGLRMAQGSFATLQRDPQFGPVLLGASEVLARLTQALR